jgi:hypothetical protein
MLLADKVVPQANFFDVMGGEACWTGPLYQSLPQFIPVMLLPIAVGLAEAVGRLCSSLPIAGCSSSVPGADARIGNVST